jgi:hypothetical protein
MVIARAAPGKCETPCATQRKGNSHEITLSLSYVLGRTGGKLFIFYFYVCIVFHIEQLLRELQRLDSF